MSKRNLAKAGNPSVRFKQAAPHCPKGRGAGDDSNYPDWKEVRLGEVVDVIGGGTPDTKNPDYWAGDINWFTPTEIGQQKYMAESNRKITRLGLQKSSARLLPKGTILLTTRATLGERSILLNEATTNQGFQSLVPKDCIDSEFLYYLIYNIDLHLNRLANGSTFLEVSKSALAQISYNIPTHPEEQQKIAAFFTGLDGKIGQFRQALAGLRAYKKAMLQRMFPSSGEGRPPVRFPGSFPDWAEVRLGEVVKIPKKAKIISAENLTSLTVSLHCKGVKPSTGLKIKISDTGRPYYVRNAGELIIGRQNFHNGSIALVPQELGGGITSNALSSFEIININSYLLYTYLARESFYKPFGDISTGTGQKEISEKTLLLLKLTLPTHPEEQQKIAAFFSTLDGRIDAASRKLELSQQYKKAMLQRMFP